MMDITRNQYFFRGPAVHPVGGAVSHDRLGRSDPRVHAVPCRTDRPPLASVSAATQSLTQSDKPLVKKTIHPPDWIGWSLISIGAVLILHSWGMKKGS